MRERARGVLVPCRQLYEAMLDFAAGLQRLGGVAKADKVGGVTRVATEGAGEGVAGVI